MPAATTEAGRTAVAYRWRTKRDDNSNQWNYADTFSPSFMENCIEFEPLYTALPVAHEPVNALLTAKAAIGRWISDGVGDDLILAFEEVTAAIASARVQP